jgi:hypothetical protein
VKGTYSSNEGDFWWCCFYLKKCLRKPVFHSLRVDSGKAKNRCELADRMKALSVHTQVLYSLGKEEHKDLGWEKRLDQKELT